MLINLQNFGGQSSKTKKLLDDEFKNFLPNFSKLLNFGSNIFVLLESFKTDYKGLNFVG